MPGPRLRRLTALRRPACLATVGAVLAGTALAMTPALAAPKPPPKPPAKPPATSKPSAGSTPPSAPPPPTSSAPPTLPKVPVTVGQLPPVPPANDVGPPAVAPPEPPPGGYTQKVSCIQSNAHIPLERKPWPQDMLQINKAHEFATGADQTVGVIDTGVTPHKYLRQPRLIGGGDYVEPQRHGLKDCDGHGTEVAGIIAANSNGAVGFDGMAPNASILSVRQTSVDFETNAKDPSTDKGVHAGNIGTLADAVMWTLHQAQVDRAHLAAINISLTSCITNPGKLDDSWRKLQAAIDYAVNVRKVVIVAAAGNKTEEQGTGCVKDNDSADPRKITSIPIPPWLGDNVMTVGSIGQQGDPSTFSISGPWVKVAAPGENLISLDPGSPDHLVNQSVDVNPDKKSDSGGEQQASAISGTSFAAPYVAGLVALIKERYPNLDAHQVMRRIEMTAQHPGGPDGRNNKVGYGMINPIAALTATIPQESGARPQGVTSIPADLPPPYDANTTATTVALGGGGAALALLLLTGFILHTVKRARERRAPSRS